MLTSWRVSFPPNWASVRWYRLWAACVTNVPFMWYDSPPSNSTYLPRKPSGSRTAHLQWLCFQTIHMSVKQICNIQISEWWMLWERELLGPRPLCMSALNFLSARWEYENLEFGEIETDNAQLGLWHCGLEQHLRWHHSVGPLLCSRWCLLSMEYFACRGAKSNSHLCFRWDSSCRKTSATEFVKQWPSESKLTNSSMISQLLRLFKLTSKREVDKGRASPSYLPAEQFLAEGKSDCSWQSKRHKWIHSINMNYVLTSWLKACACQERTHR